MWFSRETEGERALSEMYENSLEALSATKAAYSPDLILKALPIAEATDSHKTNSLTASALSSAAPRRKIKTSASAQRPSQAGVIAEDRLHGLNAVAKWRALTQSRLARPAEWRRLAVTMALFQHPGALEAAAHVEDTPPASLRSTRQRASLRSALQKGTRDVDPFGHGPVTISPAQERAFWNALYGREAVHVEQVPALRDTLQHLRLGWFENVALAQLYHKAGLKAEAIRAARAADISPQQVRSQNMLQVNLLVYGILAWLAWGVLSLLRWLTKTCKTPQKPVYRAPVAPDFDFILPSSETSFGGQTVPPGAVHPPLPTRTVPPSDYEAATFSASHPPNAAGSGEDLRRSPSALFPVSALLLAFLTYLVGHNVLGFTLAFALKPFVVFLSDWSASGLLRLEFALEMGLYVLIFLLPLLVLRARAPRDPVTGMTLSMSAVLARLGYYTRNIVAEIGAGAMGYLLTIPFYLLISLLSHYLFHRFHTPVNPAQFDTLTARMPLDKLLVFLTAAVAAPIVEETMFRGLLYSALRARFGVAGGACLSAAVFAAVHPTLPGGFLPIWCLGVALALVYERRGSLLPGMVLHGLHNGLVMMIGMAVFS